MSDRIPNEIEAFAQYRRHLGPRMEAAGVGLQFHGNQGVGIAFKASPKEAVVRAAIQKGIEDGILARYGAPLSDRAIWVTRVEEDPVDSSPMAFYFAARGAVDLAHSIVNSPRP